MTDVVLHIGFGKSGSTALQNALSSEPILRSTVKSYDEIKYITIDQYGNLEAEKILRDHAMLTASRSVSSADVNHFEYFTEEIFSKLRDELAVLSNNNQSLLVLSCESWVRNADIFAKCNILKQLDINAQVIAYIRNPVEWINSAWWQWGAWSGIDLKTYVNTMLDERISKWYLELESWKELVGSENFEVNLLPKDIVENFYRYIGVDMTAYKENRGNSSLPKEILRLYQKHKELRKSEHDNELDFILSRHMKFDETFSKTPWVLDETLISLILKKTRYSNLKISNMLDHDSKKSCLQDARWWNTETFFHKELSAEKCQDDCLSKEDLEKMLLSAIRGIEKLNTVNLLFRKEIQKLKKY